MTTTSNSTSVARRAAAFTVAGLAMMAAGSAHAIDAGCSSLPSQAALKAALVTAVTTETYGLKLNMWGTIVNRDGIVCAVAYSGSDRGSQWPASRVISAQKANTANSLSLDGSAVANGHGAALALSTANLYSAVQPGGSLFGLQFSNPVETIVAYAGPATAFGSATDPMVGKRIGGVNVFGGGLALYGPGKVVEGAVGVSGDTSCEDHRIGWRVRKLLGLDHLLGVGGVSGDTTHPDNMIFLQPGEAPNGFKHPACGLNDDLTPSDLPAVQS